MQTITALPASGVFTGIGSAPEVIGNNLISVEVPVNGAMMDFIIDPNKVLSRVLSDDEITIDPTAMLLFNNRDTDGNIIAMSGKSDPIKFTNKGRMPVNATLTIKPESTFNETDSGINLVEKISGFDGEKANVYLAAGLPDCESIPIGKSGGAVINALVPDSRENFTLERTGELKFEYKENEDTDNWNALEIYLTGDVDILYPNWNDIPPSKLSNAKYTTVWKLTTVPESADILNTAAAKEVTIPLQGAKKSAKKIYIKPLSNALFEQLEPECFDIYDDYLKMQDGKIILKDAFAKYCKEKWGKGRVLVYSSETYGVIVTIV